MAQVVQFTPRRDAGGAEPLVSQQTLASHFDVTTRTIRRWTEQGMPKVKHRNGTVRYRVSECEDWLHDQ